MPRTEKQNQTLRDARKEQILQAATKVFARRGMVAAKISDIAKEAQLSHGLVYHYFSSKEEIFIDLVRSAAAASIDVVRTANQRKGTAAGRLYWMTEQILRNIEGEQKLLFLMMIQASTSDAIPEEVKEILLEHSPVQEIIPLIIEAQTQGDFIQDDPVKMAVTYYAFIQGLAINKIQWEECPLPDADMLMKIFGKTDKKGIHHGVKYK